LDIPAAFHKRTVEMKTEANQCKTWAKPGPNGETMTASKQNTRFLGQAMQVDADGMQFIADPQSILPTPFRTTTACDSFYLSKFVNDSSRSKK
tara:strand:+ start:412 stop:690 length:279 start_codon:yes stop_codon:yes gene_type:complete